MRGIFYCSASALAALLVTTSPSAWAQNATPNSAEDDSAKKGDGTEIIVTATRREQSVLDVPLSLTALSGDTLVENNQDDLADYIRQVPGVNFSQSSAGLNAITIRGVTGGFQRAKAPVSFYIDEMPVVSDPVATPDIKSFDVERVEILRGPQGTLFGESAIGGVIRVISKRPDPNNVEARFQAGYLSFAHGDDGYTFDALANIPLVADQLAVRASVSYRREGGYIDNLALGNDDQNTLDYISARGKILWTPSERLEISGMAYVVRSEYGAFPSANRNYDQSRFIDEQRDDNITQFNGTITYDFNFAKLTSSSSYFKRKTARLFDLRAAFNGFLPGILIGLGTAPAGFSYSQFYQTLDIDDKSFAQEIRLVSPGTNSFRWVTGLYYFDTRNDVGVDFLGTPDLNFNYLRLRRKENYEQKAVFAEFEYDIAERLTLVAGARYTDERRQTIYDQTDDFPFTVFLPANGNFEVDVDYNILTPKFAIQFRPSKSSQIYASATRGFRGPGGNTDFDNVGNTGEFGAETLWSYELGTKNQFFDRRLTIEASAFYSDWKDRQEIANPTAPLPQQFVANLGDARLWGVEVAASVRPTSYLTLGGQVSYLNTKIIRSTNAALVGTELRFQPEWHLSGYLDGNTPLGGGYTARGHIDVAYQSNAFWSATVRNGRYTLINTNIGIQKDRWGVNFFIRNLADEFIRYSPNGTEFVIGQPRTIGASFDVRF